MSRSEKLFWPAFGLSLLSAAFVTLEWIQPSYFCQDDNLAQFLPIIVQGCRGLLATGHLPTFNPLQMLGTPTSSIGIYALTYPPTVLAYLVAEFLLGDPYTLLEVFCIGHLVAGFIALYSLLRRLRVAPPLACCGTLALCLSGCMLVMGRSWYYLVPVALWSPILLHHLLTWQRGPVDRRWALSLGLSVGLFFHAGNVQLWLYTLLLCGISVGLHAATHRDARQRLPAFLPALCLAAALSVWLFSAQFAFSRSVARGIHYDAGIKKMLPAMLLPYPYRLPENLSFWGGGLHDPPDLRYRATMFYFGTLHLAVALFLLVYVPYRTIRARRPWRRVLRRHHWSCVGGIALLFALGDKGGVWTILSWLPGFGRFMIPMKFLPLVILFTVVGSSCFLQRRLGHRPALCRAVALGCIALLAWHVPFCRYSFYTFSMRPYEPMPASLMAHLRSEPLGRVYSLAPARSHDPDHAQSLQHNFATAHGLSALNGYQDFYLARSEPIRRLRAHFEAEPLAFLRAYGLRWVYVPTPPTDPGRLESFDLALLERVQAQARLVETTADYRLFEVPGVRPLAFDPNGRSVPLHGDTGGLTLRIPTGVESLTVTVPWSAHFRTAGASLDRDAWDRLVVGVPPSTRTVRLDYRPYRGLGGWLSLLLGGLAAFAFLRPSLFSPVDA